MQGVGIILGGAWCIGSGLYLSVAIPSVLALVILAIPGVVFLAVGAVVVRRAAVRHKTRVRNALEAGSPLPGAYRVEWTPFESKMAVLGIGGQFAGAGLIGAGLYLWVESGPLADLYALIVIGIALLVAGSLALRPVWRSQEQRLGSLEG